MREILYRGKCIYNGEWVYGDLIHTLGGNPLICTKHVFGAPAEVFEVDYATVGQYIGVKDKDGNKIFEGDICQFDYKPHPEYNNPKEYFVTAIVEWSESGCGFVFHNVLPRSKSHPSRKQYFKIGDYRINGLTIIGNIYDMEGGEK